MSVGEFERNRPSLDMRRVRIEGFLVDFGSILTLLPGQPQSEVRGARNRRYGSWCLAHGRSGIDIQKRDVTPTWSTIRPRTGLLEGIHVIVEATLDESQRPAEEEAQTLGNQRSALINARIIRVFRDRCRGSAPDF